CHPAAPAACGVWACAPAGCAPVRSQIGPQALVGITLHGSGIRVDAGQHRRARKLGRNRTRHDSIDAGTAASRLGFGGPLMFSPWRLGTLVVAGLLSGLNAAAQEAVDEAASGRPTSVPLRQIYVPAEDPTGWPAGDWVPVSPDELGDLLNGPEVGGPAEAYLEKVVYKARVSGTTLVGGTLEAVPRLRG